VGDDDSDDDDDDSEKEDKDEDEKGKDDDDDDAFEMAAEYQEVAAFTELVDEYPVTELLLVGMASFRDKHLWFENQLDRIQVRKRQS
jgi:hypothetical protein